MADNKAVASQADCHQAVRSYTRLDGFFMRRVCPASRQAGDLSRLGVALVLPGASRTALLTGGYPNRVGILGALGPDSKVGIHFEEMTIAEVLRNRF